MLFFSKIILLVFPNPLIKFMFDNSKSYTDTQKFNKFLKIYIISMYISTVFSLHTNEILVRSP